MGSQSPTPMAGDDGLQAEKETEVDYSVGQLVDMSRALSEGEFGSELPQDCQSVLRQRLEKIQSIIGHVQHKTVELTVKVKVKKQRKIDYRRRQHRSRPKSDRLTDATADSRR